VSVTDLCPDCRGDCPMIDCPVCGGCEEIPCGIHYPTPGQIQAQLLAEADEDDEDDW
jgi:hypothetical protein